MSASGTVPTVIMAGGKAKPEIIAATGVDNRALIEVNGVTMLSRVVGALKNAPSVGAITVVGDLPDSENYTHVRDHGGFVENLFAGVDASEKAEYILISTADIPYITGEVVEDFIQRGRELNADIVYPVVRVEDCYKRFPGMKRTAVSIREGKFTGGNLILARPEFLQSHRARIAQAYAARKTPLRLALMLGLGATCRAAVAIMMLPKVLSITQLEQAAGRMLGGVARAYVSPYPEIATDVDKVSDLEALKELTNDQ